MIHDHTLLITFQGKVGPALSLSKLHSCIKLEEKKFYYDVPNQDWPSSGDAFPLRTMGQNYWSRHIPQLNASCQDVSHKDCSAACVLGIMTDPARCNPLWEALGAGEEKQLCGTCLRLRAVVGLTRTAMYDSWHLADRASERYQPTEP